MTHIGIVLYYSFEMRKYIYTYNKYMKSVTCYFFKTICIEKKRRNEFTEHFSVILYNIYIRFA